MEEESKHELEMVRKGFILLVSLVLFAAVQMVAQTKRALVIGIGQQEDKSWAKINGDRDVPLVKEMLTAAGYKQITFMLRNPGRSPQTPVITGATDNNEICKIIWQGQ